MNTRKTLLIAPLLAALAAGCSETPTPAPTTTATPAAGEESPAGQATKKGAAKKAIKNPISGARGEIGLMN